jgi:hypothetical protein
VDQLALDATNLPDCGSSISVAPKSAMFHTWFGEFGLIVGMIGPRVLSSWLRAGQDGVCPDES